MSPLSRLLGLVLVLLVASCTLLPIPGRAAEIGLEWTENSTTGGANEATGCRVYERVGVTWTMIATVPRGADANATVAGRQQRYTVTRGPGTYTFRVLAYNSAGESGPSNTVTPTVATPAVAPPAPTGLIFTVTVP